MAEEQRWRQPEGHTLCANNCGFFGSPTTLNLCSKCYKAKFMMEPPHLAVEAALRHFDHPIPTPEPPSPSLPQKFAPCAAPQVAAAAAEQSNPPASPNRCGACRKRVALVGFTCRCGSTFCGSHRYPEEHGCGFDYKSLGRAAIARANPVIKGKKLDKI